MKNDTPTKPTYAELEARVTLLECELSQLRRLIFGQKRERFVPATPSAQLDMTLDTAPSATAPVETEQVSYTRQKKTRKVTPHGRQPLPAHLPRTDVVLEPEQDLANLKKIGEEITEELEYTPGRLHVIRYIRPKYALPQDEGVLIANLPSRPIEKGIAGPGLLSHILVSKFVDHLPLYRQRQQFKREMVELPLSTLADWVKQTAQLLEPLYQVLKATLLKASYLQADESPLRVLDQAKKGRCHLGYMWVYHAPLAPLVLFDYRKGRSREGPDEMLKYFSGYLQTDAYDGYNGVIARPDVIALACFAHFRRYFHDALGVDQQRAEWMLERVQQLYALEEQARVDQLDFDARYRLRQASALPVLAEMKHWLDAQNRSSIPKSAIGKAIRYGLNQWSRLVRYTENGSLEIDNNWIENTIRPLALGRKNYLFAGSHEAAQRSAVIYSLIATAKKHNLEPMAYLKDVISRISDHPFKQLHMLLPPNWSPAE